MSRWVIIYKCGENYISFNNHTHPHKMEGYAPDKIWYSANTPRQALQLSMIQRHDKRAEMIEI